MKSEIAIARSGLTDEIESTILYYPGYLAAMRIIQNRGYFTACYPSLGRATRGNKRLPSNCLAGNEDDNHTKQAFVSISLLEKGGTRKKEARHHPTGPKDTSHLRK